jgi:hypothetical protein
MSQSILKTKTKTIIPFDSFNRLERESNKQIRDRNYRVEFNPLSEEVGTRPSLVPTDMQYEIRELIPTLEPKEKGIIFLKSQGKYVRLTDDLEENLSRLENYRKYLLNLPISIKKYEEVLLKMNDSGDFSELERKEIKRLEEKIIKLKNEYKFASVDLQNINDAIAEIKYKLGLPQETIYNRLLSYYRGTPSGGTRKRRKIRKTTKNNRINRNKTNKKSGKNNRRKTIKKKTNKRMNKKKNMKKTNKRQ